MPYISNKNEPQMEMPGISNENKVRLKAPEVNDAINNDATNTDTINLVADKIDELLSVKQDLKLGLKQELESELDLELEPALELESDLKHSGEDILLPELQGLEILKEGTYAIDPEKTIINMVTVVKRMEVQLQDVLLLNSNMEKDIDDSKEMILDLRAEKAELEDTIARMEKEIPSKRELQMEIEYLVEERNAAQVKIRDLLHEIQEIKNSVVQSEVIISDLKKDNEDSRIEADYLVSKLNSLMEKNRTLLNEAKKMKHDRDSNIERVHTLEKDLKELDMKRYRRYKEKSI